ncbi:ABC transporter substrate-binding protein [Paracraurococcus ruber]|uniref:Branched-chain amino acid ABC transporter substrate-binding protein n=1 Tax=Paracraurococcus ruber TaxID=77675 RepID=A0ABS1CS31_9PROT|nr:ABC transporter substrate-binding protein [Paracraurococcus ruber]MBK1657266.1 branched-chain amino acid ABC transporter substrate-binding protein [Paracraurococcus ruber]TDG33154.1 branched-chain amino acid ABC transporter substrate-binding protein [Paracraurococcus ruber]
MEPRIDRRRLLLGAGAAAAATATGLAAPAIAQNAPIRIGWLATLEGPFATGGQDGFRCMQMLLEQHNNQAGGRRIEVVRESSNAQADVALARARKLIEQDNVDFILGPLSGAEGIALRDYSRTLTGKTIINGSSGASDTTLRNPSPNFFRFNTDGVQWMAGLGNYVRRTLNVQEVAIVAGDYAFPYAQVFGFSMEFCRAGGRATYLWSPLGTTDYSSIIARIPRTAGALVVIHGGTDGLAFMTQYAQAGGSLPLIGGSIMADQSMLSARGPHRRLMLGMVSGGPIADVHDDPTWNEFVERYRRRWSNEGGFRSPSIHGFNFYTAQQAALLALEQVRGDLSGNQQAFQQALVRLEFKNAMGAQVKLDHNRQAISDIFLNRIEERGGQAATVTFGRTNAVNQTLGVPEAQFLQLGAPSRDNTGCVA